MQVLSPRLDIAAFYQRLAASQRRVLMLDYDGTLAPFKIRPQQAAPYPGVAEALGALLDSGNTHVVIVSGRRAAEVADLLPPGRRPEIWGAHGWERVSPEGEIRLHEPGADVRDALARAEFLAAPHKMAGMRLERKLGSVALHWRGMPPGVVARLREQLTVAWKPLVGDGLLEWLPFDGGLELRAHGTNKGHAVEAVLRETAPGTPAAYLGDDVTDEDAFRAVKKQGLAVLVRPEYRDTAADLWLRPPHELLAFLERWRTAREGHG